MNDLSAHPATTGPNTQRQRRRPGSSAQTIVLNTLSSLTNRENRYAAPRFADDFYNFTIGQVLWPTGFRTTSTATRCRPLSLAVPERVQLRAQCNDLPQLIYAPNYAVSQREPVCWRFRTSSRVPTRTRSFLQISTAGFIRRRRTSIDQADNQYQFDNDRLPVRLISRI